MVTESSTPPYTEIAIRKRTVVLCYHAISEDWPAALAVPARTLHDSVTDLLRRGFRPLTFSDAITRRDAEKAFAITFDDAFRSVIHRAWPVLDALGVPGTVFVPTAYAGDGTLMSWPGIDHWKGSPWESELTGAAWDELRDLAAAGWEIGSHTRTHPRLTTLDHARLESELRQSRADCERELKRSCTSIAYPYGDVDGRVAAIAKRSGYRVGASLPARLEGDPSSAPDPMRWPRAGVYRGDGVLKVRAKETLLRRAPRVWAAAQEARRRSRRFIRRAQ